MRGTELLIAREVAETRRLLDEPIVAEDVILYVSQDIKVEAELGTGAQVTACAEAGIPQRCAFN